ncbi:uncharacterized membrane protein HdeD (DUF308 family) [Methanofollis sp. W23]|uniref:hypothetical protein n=1 Tax=Methanofollis sp. W23 TaxID=2817849 RepID=UPI001AE52E28|nr:hypothetical protein [Methanofollis sp. W23]MBP2145485.1 uncharacterized membrane protein HdeD (DUF308 family) [Methanofollis sp. W23]
MTRLEEFLGPLDQGIWEVAVPKEAVTEPLDDGWIRSRINIPSPGTLASYRKGNYHLHETATEWRVHYDRYDPTRHPLLHLIDDAPLILMIGETFLALVTNARTARNGETTRLVLEGQRRTWQFMVLAGCAVLLAALAILARPIPLFAAAVSLLVPLLIAGLGLLIVGGGISLHPPGVASMGSVFLGVCVVALGFSSASLPVTLWTMIIFVVLAVWMCASAFVSFRRVYRERRSVPEGVFKRLGLGVLSLVLGSLIVLAPQAFLTLMLDLLALVLVALALVFIENGAELRRRMAGTNTGRRAAGTEA